MGRQMEHAGPDPLHKCCVDSSPHDTKLLFLIPIVQQPGRILELGRSINTSGRQRKAPQPEPGHAHVEGSSTLEIYPPHHMNGITAGNSHAQEGDEEAYKPNRVG